MDLKLSKNTFSSDLDFIESYHTLNFNYKNREEDLLFMVYLVSIFKNELRCLVLKAPKYPTSNSSEAYYKEFNEILLILGLVLILNY